VSNVEINLILLSTAVAQHQLNAVSYYYGHVCASTFGRASTVSNTDELLCSRTLITNGF